MPSRTTSRRSDSTPEPSVARTSAQGQRQAQPISHTTRPGLRHSIVRAGQRTPRASAASRGEPRTLCACSPRAATPAQHQRPPQLGARSQSTSTSPDGASSQRQRRTRDRATAGSPSERERRTEFGLPGFSAAHHQSDSSGDLDRWSIRASQPTTRSTARLTARSREAGASPRPSGYRIEHEGRSRLIPIALSLTDRARVCGGLAADGDADSRIAPSDHKSARGHSTCSQLFRSSRAWRPKVSVLWRLSGARGQSIPP